MHYTYFEIENFKGIKKLRLDLTGATTGRIHTLVGLNESGKTTILEAIDRITSGQEQREARELAGTIQPDVNDLIPIALRANFNGTIKIEAGVKVSDADIDAVKKYMKKEHSYTLANLPTDFTITHEFRFVNSIHDGIRRYYWHGFVGQGRKKNQRKNWPFSRTECEAEWSAASRFLQGRLPAIRYFPNFLFDFPDRIYLRPQTNETKTESFYRGLLQDVLDALGSEANVEEHLLNRILSDKSSDVTAFNNLTLQMARRLSVDIFEAWKEILRKDVSMRVTLLNGISTEAGTPEPYLELQIEGSDGYYRVNERSLGFRWFFIFLLLTTFRGFRRDSVREPLYLLDEPASNLHSSAQVQLLQSLARVAAHSRIMYTTHSQHLINPDWLEDTFVVRNNALTPTSDPLEMTTTSRTDVVAMKYRAFASQHPDQSQYFQPVLDVLEYSPSRLEMVPDLILVEGKNDFYSLRLAELVLKPRDALHFYPGMGAGSLDPVIALYLAWGRRFLVLLDSDAEGTKQKQRYVDKFGALLENRVLTVGDLDQRLKGHALDSAFDPADLSSLGQVVGKGGRIADKKAFYRAVQEKVAASSPIVFSAAATSVP